MANFAYKRVSTEDQSTQRQLDSFEDSFFEKIYEDKVSGKSLDRPALNEMLTHLRENDTLYVHSLDRLGRNTKDLIELMDRLKAKKVKVVFHKNNMTFDPDIKNPMNELMFTMLSAFAQFERDLTLERQREGIAIAKREGKYKGRTKELNDELIKNKVEEGLSYRQVAKELNISLSSVQRAMKKAIQ